MGLTLFLYLGQTAPCPLSEASVSRMNSLSKLGYPSTGVVVKASFSASKAFWCSDAQTNLGTVNASFFDSSNVVASFLLPFVFLTLVGPTNWCRHLAMHVKFGYEPAVVGMPSLEMSVIPWHYLAPASP